MKAWGRGNSSATHGSLFWGRKSVQSPSAPSLIGSCVPLRMLLDGSSTDQLGPDHPSLNRRVSHRFIDGFTAGRNQIIRAVDARISTGHLGGDETTIVVMAGRQLGGDLQVDRCAHSPPEPRQSLFEGPSGRPVTMGQNARTEGVASASTTQGCRCGAAALRQR